MDNIKDKNKFFIQAIKQLDELKKSLTKDEKTILYESLETTLDIDEFTKINIDEIIEFLSMTPRQRKSTKKWQYNYIPLAYSAYLVSLSSFNTFVIPYTLFVPDISYRKNISKIAKVAHVRQNLTNLFFKDTFHNKQL